MTNKKHVTVKADIRHDFSSILWYGAVQDKLKEHLKENIDLINSYPERYAETICRLLSRRLDVGEDELLVTDGGTGAIHLIAKVYEGAKSLMVTPANMEFRHALEIAGHEITEVKGSEKWMKESLEGYDYCWISNPNAINGRLYSRKSLIELIRSNPSVTFVVDMAASAFVLEDTLKPADIKRYNNLIVISSFSNPYNLPGMRVGYIVAEASKVSELDHDYTPRCVGTMAMEAIRFILIHPAQFTIPIRKWHRNAKELIQQLEILEGLEVISSSTPYFLVRMRVGSAVELDEYLQKEHGLKVGTAADDLDLESSEMRITARDTEANEELFEAIREGLENLKGQK